MITPALAGEIPYIAIVGNDLSANVFHISQKSLQFVYDEVSFLKGEAMCFPTSADCERFIAHTVVNQPEICDLNGYTEGSPTGLRYFSDRGQVNAVTRKGNLGWYEWYIRLPMKPSGEIKLVFQCGVLKPNAFAFFEYDAVTICAAETGERIGPGLCTRQEVDPGSNPLLVSALPRITAKAFPGKYNFNFKPFNLTAFRNPGTYNPFSGSVGALGITRTTRPGVGSMVNGAAGQLLNGVEAGTRILLKSCMDETIVTKLPITGQLNASGDLEWDLEYGDLIYVRIDIPRSNTVDIYCHEQSLRVMGIGETWY
jgi:hypothetical protein